MSKKYTGVFFGRKTLVLFTAISIFITSIKFIWLHENPSSRHKSASFGRSRSGKYRQIRPTYSDFLLANVFRWGFLYAAFFAANIPLVQFLCQSSMLCIYLLIKIQAQSVLSLVNFPQFMFTTLLFPPIKRLVRLVGNNVCKEIGRASCRERV